MLDEPKVSFEIVLIGVRRSTFVNINESQTENGHICPVSNFVKESGGGDVSLGKRNIDLYVFGSACSLPSLLSVFILVPSNDSEATTAVVQSHRL